ncbi:MAG: hypothetical protein FJ143_13335 [Deltaproteobacteria bacterium]|nr:hypothetical protein [Deltaproteobacteria bacterium]
MGSERHAGDEDIGLLEEGIRSYLKATTAITAFEREIQSRCREVLESQIDEYSSALMPPEPLAAKEIADFAAPAWDKFDPLYRWVGAAIEGKHYKPTISWWGTYCGLEWEAEACYVGVAEWIGGPRIKSEQLFEQMRNLKVVQEFDEQKGAGLYQFQKYVGICQRIKPEEAASLDKELERLMQKWIGLWNKIGGMEAIFK